MNRFRIGTYIVNTNQPYSWSQIAEGISKADTHSIRRYARENGLIKGYDQIRWYGPANNFADFSKLAYKFGRRKTVDLPRSEWAKKRTAHNNYLDIKWFGGIGKRPDGWTWHQMAEEGKMQLVPFGVHSASDHTGGYSILAK